MCGRGEGGRSLWLGGGGEGGISLWLGGGGEGGRSLWLGVGGEDGRSLCFYIENIPLTFFFKVYFMNFFIIHITLFFPPKSRLRLTKYSDDPHYSLNPFVRTPRLFIIAARTTGYVLK